MKNYINKRDILNWYIYKILLIMRLTTVILMVSMLQVSAATVAQEFNYVKKGASLIQIFKEIKKQTGYNIIWNEKKIDVTKTIDADFKKATIQHVLDKCLSNLPLSYSINDKMVMIKEEEPSFRDKVVVFFSAIDVRGRVVDENNVPLVGATVKVKGTDQATSTSIKGEFLLTNVDENAMLVISFLGYKLREIKAAVKMGDIKLIMSQDNLQEVEINAGYYTVTERERTGSITKIDASTIEKQPVNNPLLALQGRVPGLEVTQLTGIPGGGLNVRIRGQNSLKSGNEPLLIVDGVAYPIQNMPGSISTIYGGGVGSSAPSNVGFLNPNDISSIEVLKDADATAIYGSRGANGVLLITTKKGHVGDTRVNARVDQGFSKVGHHVKLLNTQQYLAMRKEAFTNDGLQPGTADNDINGIWNQNKYTDWQKELIGKVANNTSTALNISGGNKKSNYIIGGNYYSEGTVFPGDFGLKRSSIHSSISLGSSLDRFSATFTATYSNTKNKLLNDDLTSFILLAPNAPDPYDEYGKINWNANTFGSNPMAKLLKTNDATTDNLVGNLILSYQIVKNLILKSSLGYNTIKRDELLKSPFTSTSPTLNPTAASRSSRFSNNQNNNLLFEPQLDFNLQLSHHKFSALVGFSFQNTDFQSGTINSTGYSSDELMDNIASAALLVSERTSSFEYRYAAIFARLNYSLDQKYFVNLTARRDGSSRFGPEKQFANFGAIGVAWMFSKEKIMHQLPFLSFGKVRASYGITGNDQIGNYGYLSLWTPSIPYQGIPSLTVNSIANPDFAWETNKKLEAALQLGFLKDKVSLELAFYQNRSSNQLLNTDLPISTGPATVYMNLPAKVQNTGWELDLNFNLLSFKNLRWSTGFNLTIPKNKLLSYPGLSTSTDKNIYSIGQPLSIIKVYNATVNPSTGLYDIEDRNGNNVVDDGDRYIDKFLGQKFFGGLHNSITFRGINLDLLFSFNKQEGRHYRSTSQFTPGRLFGNQTSNQPSDVLNRWIRPEDQVSIQRFSSTSAANTLNSRVKDANISIVDASYIRLKSISLSYDFPKSWITKLKASNVEVSIRGQNLLTFTNYIGLDPETQTLNNLPVLRTLTMGLNMTF